MDLEEIISKLHNKYFLKEFTYSRNHFTPSQNTELEFSDNTILLDNFLITVQLKERGETKDILTPETELKWFTRKVLGKATKQIRDTIKYFNGYDKIILKNNRGHVFDIKSPKIIKKFHLVVYAPTALLPTHCLRKKMHESQTAGLIHIFTINDYTSILPVLVTPSELRDYLEFREDIYKNYQETIESLSEEALLGQFLVGDNDNEPSIRYVKHLDNFRQNLEDFDITDILQNFSDRIVLQDNPYDHYQIIQELAKLNRNELKEVKSRFKLGLQNASNIDMDLPYRVVFPRTGCGFIFVPIPALAPKQNNALQAFTNLHKYDQKLNKCIGVSFKKDGEFYDINWCIIESPWEYNAETSHQIEQYQPFGEVSEQTSPMYRFNV